MSRGLGVALAAHVSKSARRLVRMLRLDLEDGTQLAIAGHDQDLTLDIGDGPMVYSAAGGIMTSDIQLACGLEADSFEVKGPIGAQVTREAVLGGRFNGARVRLFKVNWADLSMGAAALMRGEVTDSRVEGSRFVFEVANSFKRFNQPVGELLSNICRTVYGSVLCTKVPESVVGTVTSVTDALRIAVSYPGSFADNYFEAGTVAALTGELVGMRPIEIAKWDETAPGAANLVMFTQFADLPTLGDTLTIKRGCPRTRAACMERDNIVNMRAEPEVPGSDQVLRAAIPGAGDQ